MSVNPYRMFSPLYGLDAVSKYDGQIIGTLPPHLFAVGASAYHRMLAKDGEKQVRGLLLRLRCLQESCLSIHFLPTEYGQRDRCHLRCGLGLCFVEVSLGVRHVSQLISQFCHLSTCPSRIGRVGKYLRYSKTL